MNSSVLWVVYTTLPYLTTYNLPHTALLSFLSYHSIIGIVFLNLRIAFAVVLLRVKDLLRFVWQVLLAK